MKKIVGFLSISLDFPRKSTLSTAIGAILDLFGLWRYNLYENRDSRPLGKNCSSTNKSKKFAFISRKMQDVVSFLSIFANSTDNSHGLRGRLPALMQTDFAVFQTDMTKLCKHLGRVLIIS